MNFNLFDLIGSVFNKASGAEISQQQQYNYNKQLADEERAWQEYMYNKSFQQSTPQYQMNLMRQAGLNPALMMSGNISAEGSTPTGSIGSVGAGVGQSNFSSLFNPVTYAQIANMNAQTNKINEETKTQEYLNKVEDALSNFPFESVITMPDGSESTEVKFENLRVKMYSQEFRNLVKDGQLKTADLADMLYNLAVLTGSDNYGLNPTFMREKKLPNYSMASAALRGTMEVQSLSSEMAKLQKEMLLASSKGASAFNEFLDKHKDSDILKFLLMLNYAGKDLNFDASKLLNLIPVTRNSKITKTIFNHIIK